MIDSHAHLNDPSFSPDREDVLRRARLQGLQACLVVGYNLSSSHVACQLAEKEPDLWASVGVHPHEAEDVTPEALQEIRQLAAYPRVVALGETGLDYYRNLSPPEKQREAFIAFIALAAELALPLIVHCRDAQDECLALLDKHRQAEQKIIMHCFSGGWEFARECVQRGFYLGLAGPITYPKAFALRKIAAEMPLEQLLIETDCPWLPPQPHRGERNEPAHLLYVAEAVAQARGTSWEAIAQHTAENARRVFGLD